MIEGAAGQVNRNGAGRLPTCRSANIRWLHYLDAGMDIKQNPFSFYDFLGYLTPGALFLYGCMAGYAHISQLNAFDFIGTNLSFDKAEIYIPFILLAYASGHILSFISSVVIERYSIWSVGYPSKYLLGIKAKSYFNVENHTILRTIIRLAVAILLAPISLLDWLLGHCIGFRDLYAKPLDKLLIKILSIKIIALMQEHGGLPRPPEDTTVSGSDFFRYVYHYTVEQAPNHFPKMQNYVALYGFLRTLTFLSIILFWGMVLHALDGQFSLREASLMISATSIFSYVLYMAFVKFYRRFSLEALMALAATYKLQPNDTEQKA